MRESVYADLDLDRMFGDLLLAAVRFLLLEVQMLTHEISDLLFNLVWIQILVRFGAPKRAHSREEDGHLHEYTGQKCGN